MLPMGHIFASHLLTEHSVRVALHGTTSVTVAYLGEKHSGLNPIKITAGYYYRIIFKSHEN